MIKNGAPEVTKTGGNMTEDDDFRLLNTLAQAAPYFSSVIGDNVAVAVTNLEKFICSIDNNNLFPIIKEGRIFTKGGTIDKTIKTGRRAKEAVDASRIGVPFVITAMPVKNSIGKIIGAVCVTTTTEKHEEMLSIVNNLNEGVEKIFFNATNLSAASEQLAAGAQELSESAERINREAETMDKVLVIINEVAQRTHLLGLNAAIEAARAGESGRGFNVVAEEIRKLASNTHSSVREVTINLKQVRKALGSLTEHISQVSAVSQEQSAGILEIAATLDKLRNTVDTLDSKTKEL